MRNDRRTPNELLDLLNRQVRINLTSWEKRNIKDLYINHIDRRGFSENCPKCWASAIKDIAKLKPEFMANKPILVKEQLIKHEEPLEVTNGYEGMTLNELREMFPEIKATSKKSFIEKINGSK